MREVRFLAAALAGLALAACETTPVAGTADAGGAAMASTPFDLGDWRTADEAATLAAFERTVAARYGAGVALTAASADLRRRQFNCGAAPPRAEGNRGDPPALVCRRTIVRDGCTHTWQAHLFAAEDSEVLARTRGLYDRRCGNEGLLGGPG